MSRYNNKMSVLEKTVIAGTVGVCALILTPTLLNCTVAHLDRDTYKNVRVVNKEAVVEGRGHYLIFTKLENGETKVFDNSDSLWELKFDSSDVCADIEEGKTYDFETYGWRFHPLSMYENIVQYSLSK